MPDGLGGHHPLAGQSFRGFIVGLWHGGKLYRLATYTGAAIEHLSLTDTHVHWTLAGKAGRFGAQVRYRLEIVAQRSEGGLLHGPFRVAMQSRVLESLTAQVDVRLTEVRSSGETVIFAGRGLHAGLEIMGALGDIIDAG